MEIAGVAVVAVVGMLPLSVWLNSNIQVTPQK
jgi:hypothetical protein